MTITNLPKEVSRVLVTGGAGFIGGALIRRLLSETNIKIFNLDKLGYSSDLTSINSLLEKNKSYQSRYQFLNCDLRNISQTNEVTEVANPDLIFHLAAESHVDRSIDNPSDFINSNIIGTFNLIESTRMYWDKLPINKKDYFKFHHISTDEVYGSLDISNSFFSEKTAYAPNSPYSASKASSDHLVNAWHHTYKLPVVTTNCSNNYGPWQFPEKLIPLVILKAIQSEKIPIYGKGQNIRDWLYVEDHIDALINVAANAKPGSKYCIGGSQEYTNNEIVKMICKKLDETIPTNDSYVNLISYVQDRPAHDLRYAINADKIKKDLGWSPKNNIILGLSKTIDWYLKNLDWCNKLKNNSGYSGERLGFKK